MLRIRYSLQIGELLKRVRKEAGLTQTAIADELGMNTSTNICGYEHMRRIPDLSTIVMILRVCGKQLAIVDLEEE